MRMEREGDRIVLHAQATQVPIVRQIPGARFETKTRTWSFPLSWAACVVARGIFGDTLDVGPALRDWAVAETARRVRPALEARECNPGPSSELTELYPFQRAGVRFLDVAGSALMADEMGTGKTVQTIFALEESDAFPALVVCPNGVKRGWAKEFARWSPDRRVVVADNGTDAGVAAVAQVANGMADVLVVHWEALRALSRLAPYGSIRLQTCKNCDPKSTRAPHLCQKEDKDLNRVAWAAVVADEAHRAKNPSADQTRALWALGDRADRRIALTGTPIANNAADLWSVMRFVSPEEYPAKTAWIDRYALTEQNFFSGGLDILGLRPDHRAELDRFFLPRFIRRTKAEVLPDLPPKVRLRRDVVLSGRQLKAYRELEKGMIAELNGGLIVADNALTASLRLRQLASAYGSVTSTDGTGWDQQVRLEEPSSKLDAFEECLDELGDERQVVVFAESSQLIHLAAERLSARGTKYAEYTGDESSEQRELALGRFIEGQAQVFLATTGAGGEGIDGLQVADTCIFLQRPWSAVQNAQAEDRLHRVGQGAASVTYIDLVTVGTIEEKVFAALDRKAAALQDVVRDKEVASSARVIQGDCIEAMAAMETASVDAIVCDPPYGLGFMGKEWDDLPPGEAWARECLRVLKPGGHLLAFGGTRTYHRLTCAIEDAGFEVRDCIAWMYGTGFPKSLDVSKAIDKQAGAERSVVGESIHARNRIADIGYQGSVSDEGRRIVTAPATPDAQRWQGWGTALKPSHEPVVWATKPQVMSGVAAMIGSQLDDLEAAWQAQEAEQRTPTGAAGGSSDQTATSPSASTGTTGWSIVSSWRACWAELSNAMSTSTIGTTTRATTDLQTLSSCLSEITPEDITQATAQPGSSSIVSAADHLFGAIVLSSRSTLALSALGLATANTPRSLRDGLEPSPAFEPIVVARKPLIGTVAANVLEHGTGALNIDGTRIEGAFASGWAKSGSRASENVAMAGANYEREPRPDNPAGRWPANVVLDEEAAALLDEQSGERAAGTYPGRSAKAPGGASRFFYCAKASRKERAWEGQTNGSGERMGPSAPQKNDHPTVKPIAVMQWLVRLVTPPGGTVLDPFTGSGSTGIAAVREGFAFIGIERDEHYCDIARARIGDATIAAFENGR